MKIRHVLPGMLLVLSWAATAQYIGPNGTATTVKQLLDNGRDEQFATLQGQIVSHQGGKHYTFADATGTIPIEVSPKRFPPGQPVDAKTKVEIAGKLDKDFIGPMKLEVKDMRVLP